MITFSLNSDCIISVLSKEITIYQCGLCCEEFSAKPQLQQHLAQAHNDEETEGSAGKGLDSCRIATLCYSSKVLTKQVIDCSISAGIIF